MPLLFICASILFGRFWIIFIFIFIFIITLNSLLGRLPVSLFVWSYGFFIIFLHLLHVFLSFQLVWFIVFAISFLLVARSCSSCLWSLPQWVGMPLCLERVSSWGDWCLSSWVQLGFVSLEGSATFSGFFFFFWAGGSLVWHGLGQPAANGQCCILVQLIIWYEASDAELASLWVGLGLRAEMETFKRLLTD